MSEYEQIYYPTPDIGAKRGSKDLAPMILEGTIDLNSIGRCERIDRYLTEHVPVLLGGHYLRVQLRSCSCQPLTTHQHAQTNS
jgi:hypothetical protein